MMFLTPAVTREANATTITFAVSDLADSTPGQDLWQYSFAVQELILDEGQGFTIFFDWRFYTLLESPPPPVSLDLDIITIQPDLALNSDGFYDVFALQDEPSLGGPFTLKFVWLGTGAPGPQPFTVYDTDFSTIENGQTALIPEPRAAGLLTLVAATFFGLWHNRRHRAPR